MVIEIRSEPQYHGLSHCQLRALVDSSGVTDPFIFTHDGEAVSDAVWYIDNIKASVRETEPAMSGGFPPIIYRRESFALFQFRMRKGKSSHQLCSLECRVREPIRAHLQQVSTTLQLA